MQTQEKSFQELCNQNGTVITAADTLLETAETDAEGKAAFEAELPFGQYYVKELTAPDGYYLGDETQYFTFAYAEDSTEMVEFTLQIQDKKKPEPAKSSHSGEPSDNQVIVLGAPLTVDEAAVEFAALGVLAAVLGLVLAKRKNRKE